MSDQRKPRYAILLGASAWPNDPELTPSVAFENSAREFKKYLTSETGLAINEDKILDLFDYAASPAEIDAEISRFLISVNGASRSELIIYYTGHGGFPKRENSYCLALRTSKRSTIGVSGYRVTDLASTLYQDAPRARRLLFIDACYAARAANDFIPQSGIRDKIQRELREALPDNGTALFCAASPVHDALAMPGDSYTMFTGALLDALWEGAADFPQLLSLNDLRALVWDNIRSRHPGDAVQPEVHAPDQRNGNMAAAAIFPNPAYGLAYEEPLTSTTSAHPRKADMGTHDRGNFTGTLVVKAKRYVTTSTLFLLVGLALLGGQTVWKSLGLRGSGDSIEVTANLLQTPRENTSIKNAEAQQASSPNATAKQSINPLSSPFAAQIVNSEPFAKSSIQSNSKSVASEMPLPASEPVTQSPTEIARLQPKKPSTSGSSKRLTGGKLTYDSIYGKLINPFEGGIGWSNAQGGSSWLQYSYPQPVAVGQIVIEMAGTDITSAGSIITVSVMEGSSWRTVYTLRDKVINRGFSGGLSGPQVGPQTIEVNGSAVSAVKVDMTGHGWFAASDIKVMSP